VRAARRKAQPLWCSGAHLSADKGTRCHYLHTDHPGTPVLATDKTGAVTCKAVMDAFGETGVLPPGRITMNLRFAGPHFDAEIPMHYNPPMEFLAEDNWRSPGFGISVMRATQEIQFAKK